MERQQKEIKGNLVQRYQVSDVKDILNTFLDPRYKGLPFLTATEKEEIFDNVKNELIRMHMVTSDSSENNAMQHESN